MGSIWINDDWQEKLEEEKDKDETWTEFLKRKIGEDKGNYLTETEVKGLIEQKIREVRRH